MVEDVLIAYNDSSAETSRRFFQDCADRVRQKTCEKGLNHQMIDAQKLSFVLGRSGRGRIPG